MTNYLLSLGAALLSLFAYSQECAPYIASTEGSIKVRVTSETKECFEFYLDGVNITPYATNDLVFQADATLPKAKVVLKDGTVIQKTLALSPDQAGVLFHIQSNKKGKYSLKNKLGSVELTAEAEQERKDKMAQMEQDRAQKQAEMDEKWDSDRQAYKDKKEKEKEENKDKSLLSEYKDTVQGRQGQKVETKEAQDLKGKEGMKVNSQETTADQKNSETTRSQQASTGSTTVPMIITYKGLPVTDTYVTLEIQKVVIGSATTDSKGQVKINTNLPVNTEVAYKLTGVKGGTKWSFSGLFLLQPLPKETQVPLDYVVKEMAPMMGISESSLIKSWGLE